MIQVTRRFLGSPRLPLYFFCNPTVCHHLHPRPPQPNSSPHQNTATDQVRPIGPVFQTSLQGHTLTQHTAIITDSISPAQTVPSLGSVKKHVSHPVQMSRAIAAGPVKSTLHIIHEPSLLPGRNTGFGCYPQFSVYCLIVCGVLATW